MSRSSTSARAAGRSGPGTPLWLLVAGLAMVVASGCVVPPPPPAPPGPPLTVTSVLTGLFHPWDLGFLPDGSIVFTERNGPIKVIAGGEGGEVRMLAQPADVIAQWEGGMLGLAIDPEFGTNRQIYTCFNSTLSGAQDVRVVRWVVDAGLTSLSGRTDIVTGIPTNTSGQAGRHSGCRPRFGPDGYLWVTTGDAATGTHPQDPNSLGGKVLRIDRDGNAAPGNPGAPLLAQIYTYGHRNPQGLTFRPSDGQAFTVEHGPSADDELNKLVAGANYGWDPIPEGGGAGYNEAVPMTDLTRFPTATPAIWSSGSPTLATSGATFLTGAQWQGWNGALAIACLKGNRLHVLVFDGSGNSIIDQQSGVTDQGRLRSPVQGPDGDLYVTTDADSGSIMKVHPEPA